MSTPSNARSIYQRLSLVGVGIGVDVHASMRLLSFHAIDSQTARRCTVPQPMFMHYKLRYIARFPWSWPCLPGLSCLRV
jgi:hypothetical protein